LIVEGLVLGVVVGGKVLVVKDVLVRGVVVGGGVLVVDFVDEVIFKVLVFVFTVEVGKLLGIENGSPIDDVLCVGKFVGIENGSPIDAVRDMTMICGRHCTRAGNSVAIGRR